MVLSCNVRAAPDEQTGIGRGDDLNRGKQALTIRVVAVDLDVAFDMSRRSAEQLQPRTDVVVDANHRIPGLGGFRDRSVMDVEPDTVAGDVDRPVREPAADD